MTHLKRADEQIVDLLRNILPNIREELLERQRKNDTVIVWLVGLSTGAVALIISQIEKLNAIPIDFIIWTVGLLGGAILAGVVFRGCFYLIEQREAACLFHIECFCHGASMEPNGPRQLSSTSTIPEISQYLREDMGLDGYDSWIDKNLPRDFWVKMYTDWADLWNKQERDGLANLGKRFAPLIGKTEKECETLFTKEDKSSINGNALKILRWIREICYFGALGLFLAAVIALISGFILGTK